MKTLIASLLALLLTALSVPGVFIHEGKDWRVEVGDDGFLRSYRVGPTEMLQNFPDRPSACLIFRGSDKQELTKFDAVEKDADGTIRARTDKLELQYAFTDNRLWIRYQSRVKDQEVFYLYFRPAEAVLRAVDGESDQSVCPTNTWYFDMLQARWFAQSGEALTFEMAGSHWSRWPYTAEGVGCFGVAIYPRHSGEWVLRPAIEPTALTALVFEVKGENEDFLPPGGKPALFPCVAENLGKTPLECEYRVTVRTYAERAVAYEGQGRFAVDPGMPVAVPIALALKEPNAYRAELELRHEGRRLRAKEWNFGYDFAHWQPRCRKPKDFDEFWKRTLSELAHVPVDLQQTVTKEDAHSVLYKLNYAVLNGERAYAWLRVPKGEPEEKFPARLELPSSGVNPIPPPAESRAVEMRLAIHGYDADLSNLKWEPPYPWPGGRYHNVGLEKRETYFYRNVYARCVRAVDVLASLPSVKPDRIMVFGGSQGGGLTIVTAGLNPKVAFCAPAIAGLCRLDWTVRHEAGTWPLSKADVPAGQTLDQMLDTLAYFDAANFIGQVRCPIVATLGWLDTITAAGGQLAAYAQADKNRLTVYCAPWGRHASSARTQSLFYQSHNLFLEEKPIPLPKTWE